MRHIQSVITFVVVVLMLAGNVFALPASPVAGFAPELLNVQLSTAEVAPGKSFEMKLHWRNAGGQCSLTNEIVLLHFRHGTKGYFNPDGGSWSNSSVFQAAYFPTVPTTSWLPQVIVVDPPLTVSVPEGAPEGRYDVLLSLYDRGGGASLGPLNNSLKSPIENYTSYKIGSIELSKSASAVPVTWDFLRENVDSPSMVEPKPVSEIKASRSADAIPDWAGEVVIVGDKRLGISLDKTRGYALAAVYVDGTAFESGGGFPAITVYDKSGERTLLVPSDTRWKVSPRKVRNGIDVKYSLDGFEMVAAYRIGKGGVTVSITPTREIKYKSLMLSSGGTMINIPADKAGAVSSAFLILPSNGGNIVRFPITTQQSIVTMWQGAWSYPASFFGVGYNGRGLIVRCPQYGAQWSYGTQDVNGKYSLFGEFSEAFRPSTQYFDMPRPEHHIDVQLVPVADVNGDGAFNWVDFGVTYRQRFIRRNPDPDTTLRDGIYGKIPLALPWENLQNYSQLIEQIRSIDFVPQVLWLNGAHVKPGGTFTDPSYGLPDPSHNGPGGYDYFAFKRDAAKVGARIGLYEYFQDVSEGYSDWGKVPLKQDIDGGPKRTWGGDSDGVYWQAYPKALNAMLKDGSMFRSLDKHFKDWAVGPGDTWHWDCISTMCGQQDYSPVHPATNGTDFRDDIAVLKYIKSKGIHFTSEAMQEGMTDCCDFGWSMPLDLSKPAAFENSEWVPLLPVLFQGMAYYAHTWRPAMSLLLGGKPGFEATTINREGVVAGYFLHDAFWRLIADRTVKNMIKTDNGWQAVYTQGGTLTSDLNNWTFVLDIDGNRYTTENPPETAWGVKAKLVNGKYELIYPEGYRRGGTESKGRQLR